MFLFRCFAPLNGNSLIWYVSLADPGTGPIDKE